MLWGSSCPCPDSVSCLPGPPQTGHGGSAANGAGPAASAMPRALVAAGPASATGMGTRAVATVTTSAGSASARTTLKVPTASSAPLATMGTPGEPGALQEGQSGLGTGQVGMGRDRTDALAVFSLSPGLVAPVSGSVGVAPSSPTCPQWRWAHAGWGGCCLRGVGQREPGQAFPTVCGLSRPPRRCSPVPLGPSVPRSPSPSPPTAAPPVR